MSTFQAFKLDKNCWREDIFASANSKNKVLDSECDLVNDIPTGSKHTTQNRGHEWFLILS